MDTTSLPTIQVFASVGSLSDDMLNLTLNTSKHPHQNDELILSSYRVLQRFCSNRYFLVTSIIHGSIDVFNMILCRVMGQVVPFQYQLSYPVHASNISVAIGQYTTSLECGFHDSHAAWLREWIIVATYIACRLSDSCVSHVNFILTVVLNWTPINSTNISQY